MDTAEKLRQHFEPLGFEIHPFKVSHYNESVSKIFHLNYDDNAVGYVIISTPSMFEKLFLPRIRKSIKWQTSGRDPLDSTLLDLFQEVKSLFSEQQVEIMQDFELLPNKRPKILVQTAAHVAGAAYYYQRKDAEKVHFNNCPLFIKSSETVDTPEITKSQCHEQPADCDVTDGIHVVNGYKKMTPDDMTCTCPNPWKDSKKIFGVCIHPKYGGWFAIRGVMIFPELLIDIPRQDPPDCVPTREARIELLNRFNGNWQDWTYRDIIPVVEKYSDLQKKYFATLPKNRNLLMKELLEA